MSETVTQPREALLAQAIMRVSRLKKFLERELHHDHKAPDIIICREMKLVNDSMTRLGYRILTEEEFNAEL